MSKSKSKSKTHTNDLHPECHNQESVITFDDFKPSEKVMPIGDYIGNTGKKYCYTVDELMSIINAAKEKRTRPTDPMTRKKLPHSVVDRVKLHSSIQSSRPYIRHLMPFNLPKYLDALEYQLPFEPLPYDDESDDDEEDREEPLRYVSDSILFTLAENAVVDSLLHAFKNRIQEWDRHTPRIPMNQSIRNGILGSLYALYKIDSDMTRLPLEINYSAFENFLYYNEKGRIAPTPYIYLLLNDNTSNHTQFNAGAIVYHKQMTPSTFLTSGQRVYTIGITTLASKNHGYFMTLLPEITKTMQRGDNDDSEYVLVAVPYKKYKSSFRDFFKKKMSGLDRYYDELTKMGFRYIDGVSDTTNEMYIVIGRNEQIHDPSILMQRRGGSYRRRLSKKSSNKSPRKSSNKSPRKSSNKSPRKSSKKRTIYRK